ncbi:kinesin heavy chain, putative [Leishmania tarentolae]|uniref:Kinesin heavy chain, putative n=1 Tax=Leishmania tarentolae TaxID=5689 RepID=A0A640KL14_LEITA|nr:kinesin heavy chain, putative [Leishmania tarentolae]
MKGMRDSIDHVRVCCRVRPLSASEKRIQGDSCISFSDQCPDAVECYVAPTTGNGTMNSGYAASGVVAAGRGDGVGDASALPGRHSFTFSHVFQPNAKQADVYEHVARPIVVDVLSGYNGTILMYGQTGSGKTHTMFGDVNGGAWATSCNARRHSAGVAFHTNSNEDDEKSKAEGSHAHTQLSEEAHDEMASYPCEHQTVHAEREDEERQEEKQQGAVPQPSHAAGVSLTVTRSNLGSHNTKTGQLESSATTARGSTAAAPPPSTTTTSSFCRTRATVTPLGELQQINTLQNATGSDAGECCYAAVGKPTKMFAAAAATASASYAPFSSATAEASTSSAFFRCGPPQCTGRNISGMRSAFTDDAISGVIPRAVHDIFDAVAHADPSKEFDVTMFFVEVYMEQIRDLLVPNTSAGIASTLTTGPRKLQLREDVSTNSFYVDGCCNPHVSSARDVLHLVKSGLKQRATSATAMNETSSRSHCLLNLTVNSVDRAQGVSTVGKLYLVDLAGSEKVGKTNATGLRLEEAKLINKSLSTLGMVIMSLTDPNATHTPYRDSVVTKILKDSLGGNSHTALVICCSPSPLHAQETLSTLRFGARAKAIENKAVVNRDLTAAQLRRMLETAKEEIERLHAKVQQLSMTSGAVDSCKGTLDFPVAASRKLTSAATATATASSMAMEASSSYLNELLEERATEQARLQNLRAEVAQLHDSLNSAQDIISALQEERDGYIDKVQSFQEEINVWEEAHSSALKRAATQDALLQQCTVLLRAQESEIKDLMQCMAAYREPLQHARQAVDRLHAFVYGAGTSRERRQSLFTAEICEATTVAAASQLPLSGHAQSASTDEGVPQGCMPHTLSSLHGVDLSAVGNVTESSRPHTADGNLPDGQSPNPRLQPDANAYLQPQSRSMSQPQHCAGSSRRELMSASISVSPGTAKAQQWLSRAASVGPNDSSVPRMDSCEQSSVTPAVHAEHVHHLEEQLNALQSEHKAVLQQHKEVLAELHSKQRILDLRRGHLATVKDELKREYMINKELRERLEKGRDSLRGPLEMARNDANYWRRRYEELASRKEMPRPSDSQRGSLRFVFPAPSTPLPPPTQQQYEAGCSGVMESDALKLMVIPPSADVGRGGAMLDSRNRPSIPDIASGAVSSRASGEDVLLSLSSDTTPLRSNLARLTAECED